MNRALRSAALLGLLAACAEARPKMPFPNDELVATPQGGARAPTHASGALSRPEGPFLAGELSGQTGEALVIAEGFERLPPKEASYAGLWVPAEPGALTATLAGATPLKGVALVNAKGAFLTKCGNDRTMGLAAVSSAPPAEKAGLVLLPASLGLELHAAPPAEAEQAALLLAAKYGEARRGHVAFAKAINVDTDAAAEVLVGLTKDAPRRPECNLPVYVERAVIDDDGNRLSSDDLEQCLDPIHDAFCGAEGAGEDPTRCDPTGLDMVGFSYVAPIPLAAATIAGGGVVLVEEQRTPETRVRSVRLIRGPQVLELGEVAFFLGEDGSCK